MINFEVSGKDLKVLEDCIREYGPYAQVDVAIEEMSELIKALLKLRRCREDEKDKVQEARENIAEEIADVHIMLLQLSLIYDIGIPVSANLRYKLDRQKKRLEELKNERA